MGTIQSILLLDEIFLLHLRWRLSKMNCDSLDLRVVQLDQSLPRPRAAFPALCTRKFKTVCKPQCAVVLDTVREPDCSPLTQLGVHERRFDKSTNLNRCCSSCTENERRNEVT
jgi:hypothetical protein